MSAPTTSVEASIAALRERVAAACARCGRDPGEVTIVAASKMVDTAGIRAAARCGISDFGENRLQEALPKLEALQGETALRWHFIGQLQRNKAKAVAQHFDAVHSVDSGELLAALERHAIRPIEVFLQVNLTETQTQGGMQPGDVGALVTSARENRFARVVGLMAIGRHSDDPEDSRPVFRQLAALAAKNGLRSLSMGMTEDFEVAVTEGATHIRVGRALFGERQR